MQIRTRLTLWFTSLTALLLLSSLLFIYYLFLSHSREVYFSSLRSRAIMTFVMFEKNNLPSGPSVNPVNEHYELLPSEENVLVYTLNGENVFSLFPARPVPETFIQSLKTKSEIQFQWNEKEYIGTRYTSSSGKAWLIFAQGNFFSVEVSDLLRILVMTFIVFVLILAVAGMYFSGKVLQPVTEAMNEMDRIGPSDLSKRLTTGTSNDEIQRLTSRFNQLLDRIEEAFRIQKGFLSNFSHEVRNPIGSIIAAIQLTLTKTRSAEEYRQILQAILQDALELENTSHQLLELARLTSRSNPTLFQPVRIDDIVWQAKAKVRKLHKGYHFSFDDSRFPKDESILTILGNQSLLKAAFFNLFENACKFSPDNGAGLAVFETPDNEVCIQITDKAPVLTDEEKQWIFMPFYRTEKAKDIQGSGIGLSLVHSILSLHKARLTIEASGETGNIFRVYFSQLITTD